MRITSKKVPTHLKPLTRQAVKFFVENIQSDKAFEFERINVEFVESRCTAEAWCDVIDYESGIKPTEFQIEVNISALPDRLKPKHYTEILFHELTHAWQFATGRLVIEDFRVAKFGRSKYDMRSINYFQHPWEIEAYGQQYCMNRMFWDM